MTRTLVCPQCSGLYDPTQQCPRCGAGLFTAKLRTSDTSREHQSRPDKWQQTPGGRVILGVLLALGLCYGLLQMGMACLRAIGLDAAGGHLDPLVGLGLFQGLQVVALLVGGALAGAGQPRGSVLGGAAGVLSGVLFLTGLVTGVVGNLAQSYSAELLAPDSRVHDLVIYGLPLQHAVVGAIGGLIGSFIWRPAVPVAIPGLLTSAKRGLAGREAAPKAVSRWAGPVSIPGVMLGSAVAILGALNTPTLVDFVLRASDHKLRIVTRMENQVAYGEVYGLTILLGGFLAGANRRNGLKQGTCVGLLVAAVMGGAFLRGGAGLSVSVVFPVLSALLLAPVGGLCGSELFPPVVRARRRPKPQASS